MTALRIKLPKKENIFWYVILWPLLNTNGMMERYHKLRIINYLLASFSLLILFYVFVRKKRLRNLSTFTMQVVFYAYLFLRTILAENNVRYADMISVIIYCLGLSWYIQILSDRPRLLVKAFLINLELMVYINFLSYLAFPEGIYRLASGERCWFLGYDNWWFIIIYVACFFAALHYEMTQDLFRMLLLMLIIHLTAALTRSGVLIAGIIIYDILFLTRLFKSRMLTYSSVWLTVVAVNIILMLFTGSGVVRYLVKLTGRPIQSLLGRNYIWYKALERISANWLFGEGRQNLGDNTHIYRRFWGVNAHNLWLEIAVEGGLIGAFIFVLMLLSVSKKIKKATCRNAKQMLLACMLVCAVGLSVDSILLELRGNLFFVLFVFAANMEIIGDKKYYSSGVNRKKTKKVRIRTLNDGLKKSGFKNE